MHLSQGRRFEISLQRYILQPIRVECEATSDPVESQVASRDPCTQGSAEPKCSEFGSELSLPVGSLCGWRQFFISLQQYCPNANPGSWSLHPAQKRSVLCWGAVGVFAGLLGQDLPHLVLCLHSWCGWDFALLWHCKSPNKVTMPESRRAEDSFPLQEYGML